MENREGPGGMIHIYCGDGKGKTSAAIGLAVRAAGCGMNVIFARFLKTEDSGELRVLDAVPEIRVLHLERSYGFFHTLTEQEKGEVREMYAALWARIRAELSQGRQGEPYRVLVMDEFMAAWNYGIIPREEALGFLAGKPEELEVVLTGRNPAEELVSLADYVSEIRKRKHPFDRGVPARRGIEY